jgi:hypothetical protein
MSRTNDRGLPILPDGSALAVSSVEFECLSRGGEPDVRKTKSHIVVNNFQASKSLDASVNTKPLEEAFLKIDKIIRGKHGAIKKT